MVIVSITPLPGVSGRNVLTALRTTAEVATRIRGRGKSHEMWMSYLAWATDAAGTFRALISTADVDRLLFTKRYWLLQTLDPRSSPQVEQLLRMELDERVQDLQRAAAVLSPTFERWAAARSELLIVADTDVYLHQDLEFDRVDWVKLAGNWSADCAWLSRCSSSTDWMRVRTAQDNGEGASCAAKDQ